MPSPSFAAKIPLPEPSAKARPFRVLIADDVKDLADMLSLFFKMEGMETAVAYNGAEAVRIAADFKPDLVCSDLDMPVMDGYQAARLLRVLDHDVKLIAISARGTTDDIRKARESGFDGHFTKPVTPSDLRSIITSFPRRPVAVGA